MKSFEQRMQDLEDDAAIRLLAARFADASVGADYESFKSLWAVDGSWIIHEPFFASATGLQEIDEMVRHLRKGKSLFVQFVHTGVIQLDGDTATARWIMHEVSKGPGDIFYSNYALYLDILRKSGDQWQFVQRDYHYMWVDTGAFPGDTYILPAFGGLNSDNS